MKYLGFFLSIFLLIGCKNFEVTESDYAYIGGEIINPNKDYVIIYQPNTFIDTLTLDSNNRFIYKIDSISPGIYFFKVSPENQMVFLEPSDSIMLRLNTIDFDESLVYTGKGSKKNNYLMELFLQNEKNSDQLLTYCELSPKDFEAKLDSIRYGQLKSLEEFTKREQTSELFNTVAKAKINYNYYGNKEKYPFAFYGEKEIKNLKNLPTDFYAFRKDIDYNDIKLRSFFQYYRFLEYHFNNLALEQYFKHTNDSVFARESLHFNLDKLALIDSLVQNQDIKNDLLKYTAKTFIYNSKDNDETRTVLNDFLTRSTCKDDKEKVSWIAESVMQLEQGKPIPSSEIVNFNNETLNLSEIIHKPTVVYFWSYEIKSHFKNSHKKIIELKAKYPEVDFIAINLNKDNDSVWKRSLKQYNFPEQNEYHFVNPEEAISKLVINKLQKVIVLNDNGTIVDSNANMFDPRFETILLGLLNQ